MIKVVGLAFLFLCASASAGEKNVRRDIEKFKQHAELCEHFSGEWDSGLTKERRKQIENGVTRNCGAAQKELQKLRKKYRHDRLMASEIEENANSSVVDYRK
jgi:hypothetical protein